MPNEAECCIAASRRSTRCCASSSSPSRTSGSSAASRWTFSGRTSRRSNRSRWPTDCRGKGVGRTLVEAAEADARRLGVKKLFALTYEKGFFLSRGFEVIDRLTLPEKVWRECISCDKFDACDEIAMIKNAGVTSWRAWSIEQQRRTHNSAGRRSQVFRQAGGTERREPRDPSGPDDRRDGPQRLRQERAAQAHRRAAAARTRARSTSATR